MTPGRIFFNVFPILCVALILVSVLQLAHDFTSTLGRIKADGQEYRRSPGCLPNASDVDPSLPPCRYVPVTVMGKERRTSHSNDLNRDYNTNSLDVQDGAGGQRRLAVTGDDLWNSVKVGDPITEEVWKGRVIHLSANGSSASVTDRAYVSSQEGGGTLVWAFLFVAGFGALSFWGVFRRVRKEAPWGGRGW